MYNVYTIYSIYPLPEAFRYRHPGASTLLARLAQGSSGLRDCIWVCKAFFSDDSRRVLQLCLQRFQALKGAHLLSKSDLAYMSLYVLSERSSFFASGQTCLFYAVSKIWLSTTLHRVFPFNFLKVHRLFFQ